MASGKRPTSYFGVHDAATFRQFCDVLSFIKRYPHDWHGDYATLYEAYLMDLRSRSERGDEYESHDYRSTGHHRSLRDSSDQTNKRWSARKECVDRNSGYSRKKRKVNGDYSSTTSHRSLDSLKVDKEGRILINKGEILGNRYRVLQEVGKGTFCNVYFCYDSTRDDNVAVKVIRAVDRYTDAAEEEIEILDRISDNDKYDESGCVHLLNIFHHSSHTCLVFKRYGPSLYQEMQDTSFRPMNPYHVTLIAKRVLKAIQFLHSNHIIHTDLKPENILYPLHATNGKTREEEVVVVDFGGATLSHRHHTRVISTRPYRAPEVILDLGWSYAADLWSIGCILFELVSGVVLFNAQYTAEHLEMIERTLGKIPRHMIGATHKKKFFRDDTVDWPAKCKNSDTSYVDKCKRLEDYECWSKDHLLLKLLKGLLVLDPRHRLNAKEALDLLLYSV